MQERERDDEKLASGSGGEKLRTVNSMMKKVLQQEGSRDVSSQLFVALARACGLGVRLVVSLQAVPWRAEKVSTKKKPGAGRGGRTVARRQGIGPSSENEDSEEDDMEEVPIPEPEKEEPKPSTVTEKLPTSGKGIRGAGKRRLQDPADLYRLRKPKPTPRKDGTPVRQRPKTRIKQGKWPLESERRSDSRQICPSNPLYSGRKCSAGQISGGSPSIRYKGRCEKKGISSQRRTVDQYGCSTLWLSRKVDVPASD